MNNADIISSARDLVLLHGIKESVTSADTSTDSTDVLNYTFILPDTSNYPDDFRTFLHKDLIETTTLVSLEQAGRLNWWADIGACQRLLPLATTGDGNCLLHAASLGIWGFHDRRLTLRTALCQTLTESNVKEAFQRRWRYHQSQINKQSGLIYSEEEWNIEWNSLLKLASPQPRCTASASDQQQQRLMLSESGLGGGMTVDLTSSSSEVFYESLEELHVFVLSHVLRRPIIIVADTILKDANGDAMAPISFGGVYLPLERPADECFQTPLLLTYDAAHFSAIVPMETGSDNKNNDQLTVDGLVKPQLAAAIPLVDPDFNLLPIRFAVDPGLDWNGVDCVPAEDPLTLLRRYLDVDMVKVPGTQSVDANTSLVNKSCDSKTLPLDSKRLGNLRTSLMTIPKAGSWSELARTGSIESEESNGTSLVGGRTSQRDKRRKGSMREHKFNAVLTDDGTAGCKSVTPSRTKLPLPVQSVARSFGSLGRSFKKLKKNLSMIGRRVNSKRNDRKDLSVMSTTVTPDDASGSVSGPLSVDRSHIVCARLLHRRQPYQEEMVHNYLVSAAERFERECKHCVTDTTVELIGSKLAPTDNSFLNGSNSVTGNTKMSCINIGCSGTGDATTSYLCAQCFECQQRDEISAASSLQSVTMTSTVASTAPSSCCGSTVSVSQARNDYTPCTVTPTFSRNGSMLSTVGSVSNTTLTTATSTFSHYGSPGVARETINIVGAGYMISSSVTGRRQYSDALERELEELQRSVDRIPTITGQPMTLHVD
jgi:OTU domain-containing protein 7